jgi:hypothetical protein
MDFFFPALKLNVPCLTVKGKVVGGIEAHKGSSDYFALINFKDTVTVGI